MAVIYPHFLNTILSINDKIQSQIPYPFFDDACVCYEALRAVHVGEYDVNDSIGHFGLTQYAYQKSYHAFQTYGVAGLIGINSKQLTEPLHIEIERMVFVLKASRPWLPATKMVIILKGFNHTVSLNLMRHLYASYGWAIGTKSYKHIDFRTLNLKVIKLLQARRDSSNREAFFDQGDPLQNLLEVFRTYGEKGITNRYSGSRVSFLQHKNNFFTFGLLGLVDSARPPFRNSKLGFEEEGNIIFSKIQHPDNNEAHYIKILKTKNIIVNATCLINIFNKWDVRNFRSQFAGDLYRLANDPDQTPLSDTFEKFPETVPVKLDMGFIEFVNTLNDLPVSIASPGLFLILPYLNRLKIFEKASTIMNMDPDKGYSWFSLLLLNIGRIIKGISSISKACSINEPSLPLMSGLVAMPCNDSLLNGLSEINELELLELRQYLTHASKHHSIIKARRIAFDFEMRDFTGDDIQLKNIGKGPSPKRKICFPGFRPHIAWDIDTGVPISIEFRNGKARATTTVKRFVTELLSETVGKECIEHVYIDSEYTAEHVWTFIVDSEVGLGAELTMCIKQNRKVKKYIKEFLDTKPVFVYYDDEHTYSKNTFEIPIQQTGKILYCVLKRKEKNGQFRCFGSTVKGLTSSEILTEYRNRWTIENGIKDLSMNYFLDSIPGIDPHRINIHYFVVTLTRVLFDMMSQDYKGSKNPDGSQKGLDTLRPQFLTSSNAVLKRDEDTLIVKWIDSYPESQHKIMQDLFRKLNSHTENSLPFLGGLKLRFEIGDVRPDALKNKFSRARLEF